MTTITEANVCTLKLHGRFDFNSHKQFRAGYRSANNVSSFIVDFLEVDYIDSIGLGMLLTMSEYVDGSNAKMTLVNCNSEIKSILETCNFQKIFTIT
jgi:anti-anti-sigma factor